MSVIIVSQPQTRRRLKLPLQQYRPTNVNSAPSSLLLLYFWHAPL